MPLRRKRGLLWLACALLWAAAVVTCGYAFLRAAAVGVALGAGGSDVRGEAWRMAQEDPQAMRELEEETREEQRFATREERLFWSLIAAAGGLGVLGLLSGAAAWRQRRRERHPTEAAPG